MKKELLLSFLLCFSIVILSSCSKDDDDDLLGEDPAWTALNEAKMKEVAADPTFTKLEAMERPGSYIYYKVLKEGAKERRVLYGEKVKVQYVLRLADGEVLQTMLIEDGPLTTSFTIDYGSVINGWVTILQHMYVGDKWETWIPYELSYGKNGTSSIKPYSALNYEIELMEIVD